MVILALTGAYFLNFRKVRSFSNPRKGGWSKKKIQAYNKKTGRELSLSRMKVMTLTVVGLHNNGTEMYVVLQDTDGHSYELEKKTNYTKVHFVGYNE